jgi:hypothetical protein
MVDRPLRDADGSEPRPQFAATIFLGQQPAFPAETQRDATYPLETGDRPLSRRVTARGTTTAKGMNSINDGRVAAGLAPKVVQNATLVTVLGVVTHLPRPLTNRLGRRIQHSISDTGARPQCQAYRANEISALRAPRENDWPPDSTPFLATRSFDRTPSRSWHPEWLEKARDP